MELAALPDRRLPDQVEAAAYYVVAEALANVDKHAGATTVVVQATTDGACLTVEALGGRLTLESPEGVGTRLRAEIPHD